MTAGAAKKKPSTKTAAAHQTGAPRVVSSPENLLAVRDLTREQISRFLDRAEQLWAHASGRAPALDVLRGRTVANVFFEDSTRTRTSFELAAKRLGAAVITFTAAGSSVAKGESLLDTVRTIDAMGVDAIVVRHASAGVPRLLVDAVRAPIINAGDGRHAHPTQGLLDLLTIRRRLGRLEGVHVAVVGDVANSRVARSAFEGLTMMGGRVTFVGPPVMLPRQFEAFGASCSTDLDSILPQVDVVMMLRVQHERIAGKALPSPREFAALYGLDAARRNRCKPGVVFMHPGPMNRGVEIATDVADGPDSTVLEQVAAGVAVRMAVLEAFVHRYDGD